MMKKIWILLLLLALCGRMPAFAAEIPDPQRPGSLTLAMNWNGQPLNAGAITAYQVGQIAVLEGGYDFALIPQLADGGVALELDDPDTAGALALLVGEREVPAITAPIQKGKAMFENLTPGLYLILQTDTQSGTGFAPIRPFLISLPRWAEDRYLYDITADPKVPLETTPTEPTEPPVTEPVTEPKPPEPELPQTGQLNWPVPILAVLGLIFLVGGWMLTTQREDSL